MYTTFTSPNYRRHARQLIYGLAALALLLVSVSGAEATDAKVFPGALCVTEGTLASTVNSVRYSPNGRVENASTSAALAVVCPLVRDHTDRKWAYIRVNVEDRTDQGTPTCEARIVKKNGTWIGPFSPTVEPSGLPSLNGYVGPYTYRFDSLPDDVSVDADSSYLVRCILPADVGAGRSNLISLKVSEND